MTEARDLARPSAQVTLWGNDINEGAHKLAMRGGVRTWGAFADWTSLGWDLDAVWSFGGFKTNFWPTKAGRQAEHVCLAAIAAMRAGLSGGARVPTKAITLFLSTAQSGLACLNCSAVCSCLMFMQ